MFPEFSEGTVTHFENLSDFLTRLSLWVFLEKLKNSLKILSRAIFEICFRVKKNRWKISKKSWNSLQMNYS